MKTTGVDSAADHFYVAAKLAAAGRHAAAVEEYSRSLAINPVSWTAQENLGIALSDDKRLDEAAAAFERTIQLAPERAEAYSLLARVLYEAGRLGGAAAFSAALSLSPASASLHYEVARTDQLFGTGDAAAPYFASAQRLAYATWRQEMRCDTADVTSWTGGPTRWADHPVGGAVAAVRTHHAASPRRLYGRTAPRPYSARTWPHRAGLRWPSLRFADRSVFVAELRDVWISGNEGVVSDGACNVHLPSHGHQIPLHLNLPRESVAERARDGAIRRIGVGAEAEAAEEAEEEVVVSLVQLFAANFYSFVADALARLVIAIDTVRADNAAIDAENAIDADSANDSATRRKRRKRRLRVMLPADRSSLKPWMWALLERLGIEKANSFPYPIRPINGGAEGKGGVRAAAAARVHAATLLVVDWEAPPPAPPGTCAANDASECAATAARLLRDFADPLAAELASPPAADLAHLPPRAALRLLRSRLALPGATLAVPTPRPIVYLQRAAAKIRRIRNEPQLLSAIGAVAAAADGGEVPIALLSDAPSTRLTETMRVLSRAVAIIGVHGAGWANLLFAWDGAHAIEMGLPEPHAIYTAHTAYALGLHYHLVPLRGAALHSAAEVVAPVIRVARALETALREAGLLRTNATAGLLRASATAVAGEAAAGADAAGACSSSLPPSSSSSSPVEVVVARYAEDASWCAASGFNCTIYNKGEALPQAGASAEVGSPPPRVIALPNVGRESHTWLRHIAERYETLAPWTVFMQGDPDGHLPTGLTVADYVRAAEPPHEQREAFFPLTAVARSDLRGLAFRTGYAPPGAAFFTGELVGPPAGHAASWQATNRARLPVLLQPLGLWSGGGESDEEYEASLRSRRALTRFVNRSRVAVPYRKLDAGLSMLATSMHWIERRQAEQRAAGSLERFWRRFLGGAPPSRLYHAQGAQFGVSAAAVRRHPRALYRAMLEELASGGRDPVTSYYCELVWWYLFAAPEAALGW